ncbi:MAG: hypothetical protein A2001_01575 [Treponema sp. GWC1_61_84]|nr:MAG: hypothetical protein A2001_01575 [Treponema sp. GWC1_61_84]
MNQDQVKASLRKLESTGSEFTVIFSGKNSKKVNGLYKPADCEILIHNRNFTDDNMLMYTAIHEYAHHIHMTKHPSKVSTCRAHTNAFWAIFHGLLAKAEDLGIYRDAFGDDPELVALTADLRGDLVEMAVIMKRIGKRLIAAHEVCLKINARFEDFIDRILRMSRVTARLAMKAYQLDIPDAFGPDGLRLVAGINGEEARAVVVATLEAGKSQDEAKAAKKATPAASPEEGEVERLERERVRLQKTIHSLERRLEEVTRELGDVRSAGEEDLGIAVGA